VRLLDTKIILFTVNRRAELKNKINANLKKMSDIELVADDMKRLPAVKVRHIMHMKVF